MATRASRPTNAHRAIRQLHLWIGAWGAIAAILFGFTGLVLNHRMGGNAWPQGTSEELDHTRIAVPDAARTSPEALSTWLRDSRHMDAWNIRTPRPDEAVKGPARWTLSGGSARNAWTAEYTVGASDLQLKRTRNSTLAVFSRLHKGVGGSRLWSWLVDSYAVAMVLLGLSGLWMWARGRSPRQMLFSVFALAIAVTASGIALAFA